MADPRFFTRQPSLPLGRIAELTGATPQCAGKGECGPQDMQRLFHDVAALDAAGAQDVSFLDNTKYADQFAASKAGACFVRPRFARRAPEGMLLLLTEEPYLAYALTARAFYIADTPDAFISPRAEIAASAQIGEGCRIEAGAWIGEHVKIGPRCHIGPNAVIQSGVEIGEDSRIGANAALSHCLIGKRVIVHRGAHIGQDGFGYAASPHGLEKVPQLGRVVIGDDVEIGAGTCIDRGAGPDTVIGSGSKIDNLVQIAHNVQIGRCAVIVSQVGISGSTRIGDGAQLGGQAGIAGHLDIGAGSKLAARAGVMRDVPPGETHGGAPALPIRDWHRQTAALLRLTRKETKND